jgi:FAD binding domain
MTPEKTTDPFLLAHLIHPLTFDIGGGLSPISIRDQMIRGRMLVDRALEQGLIGPDRPLLVIGAGAAGGTAAIHAAQERVKTVLIEKEATGFTRQRGCLSRWVDPTQYDWPLVHWRKGKYNWVPPDMPLYWEAAPANVIALRWQRKLSSSYGRLRGTLAVRYGTELEEFYLIRRMLPLPARDHLVEAKFKNQEKQLRFGMVISGVGFGAENCTVGDYTGYQFWDTDDFEDTDMGLDSPPRILISGGGDGALQDFLRVMTRPLKRQKYQGGGRRMFCSADSIFKILWNDSAIRAPLVRAKRNLQSAEDQAQRAYIWGQNRGQDHVPQMQLQKAFRDEIDDLWSAASGGLVRVLHHVVKDPVPNLHLVHPCLHFSKSYGLNRFLVMLIDKYLTHVASAYDSQHIFEGLGVTKVESKDPSVHAPCENKPQKCFGKEHNVTLEPRMCVESLKPPRLGSTSTYDVVIIRHGIKEPQYFFGQAPTTNPRHMLPYHVPDPM